MTILFAVGLLLLLIAGFVWWRYTSVERGARTRDESLLQKLDPIAERFQMNATVSEHEIATLAATPEIRPMLYQLLQHYDRSQLFPETYLATVEQAKSLLAYWMMHPNELQDAPVAVEVVDTVERQFMGEPCSFVVLRYRMRQDHWAGAEWILGLAGPFRRDDKPYESAAGGFSRAGDREGTVSPAELVDWYVGILQSKFGKRA